MPIYEFYCKNCGSDIEIMAPMSKVPKGHKCVACTTEMVRVYSINAGNKEYGKPLVSHSLAIHSEQVAEHNRLFPDIKVRNDGCLEFHNYQQHDKYLKKIGWEKRPQKTRGAHKNGKRRQVQASKQKKVG